jgi:Flp pilus assembly protein TadG
MTERSPVTARSGQSLIELGIVIVILVTLAMGMLEFGRAWMIANMITHAASDGARMAAITPSTSRNSSGIITDTAPIQSQVLAEIANVTPTAGFTVSVSQPTTNGIPLAQVRVDASVPYLFRLVGSSFTVARSVTFRDEGR